MCGNARVDHLPCNAHPPTRLGERNATVQLARPAEARAGRWPSKRIPIAPPGALSPRAPRRALAAGAARCAGTGPWVAAGCSGLWARGQQGCGPGPPPSPPCTPFLRYSFTPRAGSALQAPGVAAAPRSAAQTRGRGPAPRDRPSSRPAAPDRGCALVVLTVGDLRSYRTNQRVAGWRVECAIQPREPVGGGVIAPPRQLGPQTAKFALLLPAPWCLGAVGGRLAPGRASWGP